MERQPSRTDVGDVLLSFYECLTDPEHLDTLMEMLTSWLDDEDSAVLVPKLDYHAEKAWRLLGDIAPQAYQADGHFDAMDDTPLKSAADVCAALKDLINPDDRQRLKVWLEDAKSTRSLLLRVSQDENVALAVLSRDGAGGGFVLRRTGRQFHGVLTKFVADSFDLTHAEFQLVQELLQGGTLREIAARQGKSWETTRSQVKSLTNKLGVNSQTEILRIVNQVGTLVPPADLISESPKLSAVKTLTRPDGRKIAYEIDGGPSDKTLVYLHGMVQGRHWPEKARKLAKSRGWRVVRVSRAGRGPSTINRKEKDALLQDHVDDVMAIMNHEQIDTFSIFAAADGFAVGYFLGLQYPERLRMIVGLEAIPPILSRKTIAAFSGKMKTYGLACLYAPKSIKFMMGIALRQLERMEDRHKAVHPLIGVPLAEHEDADGLQTEDKNYQDLIMHGADGLWRDASFSSVDWAFAAENSNLRPRTALIHCGNSMNLSPGPFDEFAQRIGAPILRVDSYFPYVSGVLPLVLETLEQTQT